MSLTVDQLINQLNELKKIGTISGDAKIKVWDIELGKGDVDEIDLYYTSFNCLMIDIDYA